jgi:hypothetical protein
MPASTISQLQSQFSYNHKRNITENKSNSNKTHTLCYMRLAFNSLPCKILWLKDPLLSEYLETNKYSRCYAIGE